MVIDVAAIAIKKEAKLKKRAQDIGAEAKDADKTESEDADDTKENTASKEAKRKEPLSAEELARKS